MNNVPEYGGLRSEFHGTRARVGPFFMWPIPSHQCQRLVRYAVAPCLPPRASEIDVKRDIIDRQYVPGSETELSAGSAQ